MIFHSKLSERVAMCIYLIFELSVEIDFFFKNTHLKFCSSSLNRLFLQCVLVVELSVYVLLVVLFHSLCVWIT